MCFLFCEKSGFPLQKSLRRRRKAADRRILRRDDGLPGRRQQPHGRYDRFRGCCCWRGHEEVRIFPNFSSKHVRADLRVGSYCIQKQEARHFDGLPAYDSPDGFAIELLVSIFNHGQMKTGKTGSHAKFCDSRFLQAFTFLRGYDIITYYLLGR